MSIEERFSEFTRPGYYSRIDDKHILDIYIGHDEKDRLAIHYRGVFRPRKITGTKAIEINQYSDETRKIIRFSLADSEFTGLFYKFCEDLIDQTKDLKDAALGYDTIVSRFLQWKKMFMVSRNEYLSDIQIMGLIGELLLLKNQMIPMYGKTAALSAWSGQDLTHKDFSYGDTWYESKVISSGSQKVVIASLEQLDSDIDGELDVYSLEKMSEAFNGISLNKLVLEINNDFETQIDKDSFITKVTQQGYQYSDYYNAFVYRITGFQRFAVSQGFPRLTRATVPRAVIKAQYQIFIPDIAEFEIK